MSAASRQENNGSGGSRFLIGAVVAAIALLTVSAVLLSVLGIVHQRQVSAVPDQNSTMTTARVESGQLVDAVAAEFASVPEFERRFTVLTTGSSGSTAGIVTQDGVEAGATLVEGSTVVTVDERPTWLALGDVPMYRGFGPGSTGRDVAQLQAMLIRSGYGLADPSGTYGPSTAVASWWYHQDRGVTARDSSGETVTIDEADQTAWSSSSLWFVPVAPVTAGDQCGAVGQQAADVACGLTGSQRTVHVLVAQEQADRVSTGQAVELAGANGVVVAGTIRSRVGDSANGDVAGSQESATPGSGDNLSDASGGSLSTDQSAAQDPAEIAPDGGQTLSGSTGGHDAASTSGAVNFEVEFADGSDGNQELKANARGQATITVDATADDALLIPQTAILSENSSTAWLETPDGRRVDVVVGLCQGGRCSVTGESDLVDGLEVQTR